jgi:uncharacterized protein
MLSLRELWVSSDTEAGALVPRFLDERDHPWLRVLIEEHERFAGRPRRELWEHLAEPLPCAAPGGKLRLATHVLGRVMRAAERAAVSPRRARALLFAEAARARSASASLDRKAVAAKVAASLGVSPETLEGALFADLAGERALVLPARPLSPGEVALRANLVLAQSLVMRARSVVIEVSGNARALVRHAKLRGLICTVSPRGGPNDAVLSLSGPLALFRRARLYGAALGELVPLCAWCRRYRLRAECVVEGRAMLLTLGAGDPLPPASEPRRFDSGVEARFAREFLRLAPDWNLVREPEPLRAEGTLVFPDFALEHRLYPARRWLLEIVGFWTPEYLSHKLARLRAAGIEDLILCIDAERACAANDLPAGARILRYRRSVDARAVLEILAGAAAQG